MKLIYATNTGDPILVSDEDFDYLSQWNWQSHSNGYSHRCSHELGTVHMHIVIANRIGLSTRDEIDHIDRNPSNNQRNNLRSATSTQNKANRDKLITNTSGYKGVTRYYPTNKWKAQISSSNRCLFLGYFDCPKAAARKYNSAAKRIHGEFAYLNPNVECSIDCSLCNPSDAI